MHVNIPESKPLLSSCPRPLPLLLSSSPPSPPSRSARLWEVAHRLPKEVGQVLEAHEPPEHPNVMAAVEQMEGGEVGGEDAGEAGAQEEYAQGAQGQGEEGQAGVEYGQAGAEGVQYTEGGEEFAEGAKAEDEEGLEQPKKRGGHGRRKIEIEYIDDKIRRHITFSKRKAGISKKAYELSRLTGAQAAPLPPTPHAPGSCSAPPTRLRGHPREQHPLPLQVLLLISSERGQIYSFATPKLQPILVNEASKTLIEQCLNAPDPVQPMALGMPGQQVMLPIDGSIDPNDPNQQQYAEQYADGSYAEGQHPDADQLLAMQQARSKRGCTGGGRTGGWV